MTVSRRGCLLMVVASLVFAGFLGGCSGRKAPVGARDVVAAARAYHEARAHRDQDPEKAEKHLRRAIAYDGFHGPAHNDLGVLMLARGRLYEAARAFETARKNMPEHPDPRHNLALVLERGGKHKEALAACEAALEVREDFLPAIQTMAWIQVRHGIDGERETVELLRTVMARSDRERWRTWAEQHYLKLDPQGRSRGFDLFAPTTGPRAPAVQSMEPAPPHEEPDAVTLP